MGSRGTGVQALHEGVAIWRQIPVGEQLPP